MFGALINSIFLNKSLFERHSSTGEHEVVSKIKSGVPMMPQGIGGLIASFMQPAEKGAFVTAHKDTSMEKGVCGCSWTCKQIANVYGPDPTPKIVAELANLKKCLDDLKKERDELVTSNSHSYLDGKDARYIVLAKTVKVELTEEGSRRTKPDVVQDKIRKECALVRFSVAVEFSQEKVVYYVSITLPQIDMIVTY